MLHCRMRQPCQNEALSLVSHDYSHIHHVHVHVLMRDEKEERHKSTPKAVTFPKKNELPRVGLEPMTLYTLDRALPLSYQGSTAGWAIYVQIDTCIHPPGWNGSHDCARSRGIAAILRANYAPFLRAKSPFDAKTR